MHIKTLVPLAAAITVIFTLQGCAGLAKADESMVFTRSEPTQEIAAEVGAADSEAPPAPGSLADDDSTTATAASRSIATDKIWQVKAPELLARIDGPELVPLQLVTQDISVVIVGHRARIVFDMVFLNPAGSEISGTLMVQVPNRAGPSFLGMFLGNPEIGLSAELPESGPSPDMIIGATPQVAASWQAGDTQVEWGEFRPAIVVEPVAGRQVYESITRRKIDPALGEWTGTGSYSTRIFPIPANGFKRVVFAYDQTLAPDEGTVLFALPVPSDTKTKRRLTVHDIGVSYSQSAVRNGQQEVTQERSRFGRMWQVESPAPEGSGFAFHATMRNPALLHMSGVDEGITGTLTSLVISPQTPARSMVTPTGRALIFLDTSYSGKDGMHDTAGLLLKTLLETDDSLTDFAIISFDVRPTLLTSGFVPNSEEARAHYTAEVGKIWLEGATDFDAAMEYLGDHPDLAADTIFLLSDGIITWGSDDIASLGRKHAPLLDSRWICYSVGSVPQNTQLFDLLTRSGGQVVRVSPSQDLGRAAKAHRFPVSRLDGVFSMLQDEVIVAGRPEFVYPGQVLEVAVRATRATQDIRLVIRVDGRDSELKIPVSRLPLTDPIAARTWAEIYTTDLLLEPNEASIQAALSLSRHFRLTGKYASFIILETDEEYKQYEIDTPEFDFRQVRLTIAESRARTQVVPRLYSGLSVPISLGKDTESFIKGLASIKHLDTWQINEPLEMAASPDVLVEPPPVIRNSDTFVDLYEQGTELLLRLTDSGRGDSEEKEDKAKNIAQALRVLSTIAEIAPRDAQALRLTGFVLMDWGLYAEAARIFTRVRESRPFEPQNLLLEAMALAATGLAGDAALRYEIVLHSTFPRFGEYAAPAARFLYADLIRSALREAPGNIYAGTWKERLASLTEGSSDSPPAGALFLYWNLDDTDVDLHVKENIFSTVWYKRMESRSGGRLLWDNTIGLGPEMYLHPRLTRSGFEVSVDYFSSSSVEGAAPAATLVCALTLQPGRYIYKAEWHARILIGVQDDVVEVMPVWKRAR